MKSIFRPFFFLAVFILIVGMACSLGGGTDNGGGGGGQTSPSPIPQQPTSVPEVPTQAPLPPTDVPPTTAPEPVEPQAQEFFTQEFDADPGSLWEYTYVTGANETDPDKASYVFDDSRMIFDIETVYMYMYYVYTGYEYRDVRLDLRAENRGKNNNNVSLVCRKSDEGWYEFNVMGGGLWDLTAAIKRSDGKIEYSTIDEGGVNALKQGKEVNEYSMICNGDEIQLFVNGVEVKKVREKRFALRDGMVGFSVSSFNVTPIIVEVDWFTISKP